MPHSVAFTNSHNFLQVPFFIATLALAPPEYISSRYFKAPAKAHCSCSNRASSFWSAFSISETVSSWWLGTYQNWGSAQRQFCGCEFNFEVMSSSLSSQPLWMCFPHRVGWKPCWISYSEGMSQDEKCILIWALGCSRDVQAKANVPKCPNATPQTKSCSCHQMDERKHSYAIILNTVFRGFSCSDLFGLRVLEILSFWF